MVSCFEPKSDAIKRTVKTIQKIASGEMKTPNPISNIDRYQWDEEACLAKVQMVPKSTLPSWPANMYLKKLTINPRINRPKL